MYKLIFLFVLFISLLFGKIEGQPFTLDNTFNPQYSFRDNFTNTQPGMVLGIKQKNDSSLYIWGEFLLSPNFPQVYHSLVELNDKGQFDSTFVTPVFVSYMEGVRHLQSDPPNFLIGAGGHRLHKIDSFGTEVEIAWKDTLRDQVASPFQIREPFVYPDGGLLLPCFQCVSPRNSPIYLFNLARIKPSGHYDTTFTHDVIGNIEKITPYRSDSLILSGWFTHYDSTLSPLVCKIDTSGNLDPNWVSIFAGGVVRDILVLPNGKILVMGSLLLNSYPDTIGIVRINSDGSLDSTFNNFDNVTGIHNEIRTACQTTDGGYLIGGFINSYQGHPRKNIVKTDTDGFIDLLYLNHAGIDSLDPLSTSNGFLPFVQKIEKSLRGDAYYVMGWFLKYDNTSVKPIIKLHGLTVGIEEYSNISLDDIKIFPNPNNGSFQITYTPVNEKLILQVFTHFG